MAFYRNDQRHQVSKLRVTYLVDVHDLTVATRNIRDFQQAGVKVFDPFA
jgi:translation initiation factor IF-3